MPGPALHHMIADRLKALISLNEGLGSKMTPAQYTALQNLLADDKNLPYLFFGCQDPITFSLTPKIGMVHWVILPNSILK
jgi:hypothetical protein